MKPCARLQVLAPKMAKKIKPFLEGLPKRYLRTYRPEEMLRHMEMAGSCPRSPVQLHLERGRHWFELTLVTQDRPFLFAKLAGSLAAWGMNIVKADAFSNAAGVVVDTFFFTDRFRTLELNLPEWGRFQRSVADVLNGEADLERMLRDRLRSEKQMARRSKFRPGLNLTMKVPPAARWCRSSRRTVWGCSTEFVRGSRIGIATSR